MVEATVPMAMTVLVVVVVVVVVVTMSTTLVWMMAERMLILYNFKSTSPLKACTDNTDNTYNTYNTDNTYNPV